MNLNINAVILWAILTIIGYLSTTTLTGALYGLLAGLLISLLATITSK